jgi:cysteine synthase
MGLLSAIGNTPLVEIVKLNPVSRVRVMAKLEGANPAGSIKDRIAYYMIKQGIEGGQLKNGRTVVEATSGNTGIGLAMVCANYGLKLKLFMPDCASEERKSILRAFGAELAITPGCEGVDGSILRAAELVTKEPDKYYLANQYANPANLDAHDEGTGKEIWEQTQGQVTHFAAGIGTTGTIMGVARRLRRMKPEIKIIAIEPNQGHCIQGLKNLSESIIPAIWDPSKVDAVVHPPDEQAFAYVERLAKEEGIFVGLSSGAALHGALEVARDAPAGSTVVTVFPDRGDRYLSTNFFRSFCAKCPP